MSFFAGRRRSRGYAFETSIVKFFDSKQDWHARRLGGSSVGLPDVVVTNNTKGILFTIEAKSTFQDQAYIHNDQIVRCLDVSNVFGVYQKRYIVFAFKFSANKEKGRDKLHYYFFKVTWLKGLENIEWVKCFYDGRLRYKLINADVKAQLKLIKYEKLSDLKDNIIVTTLDKK